MTQISPVSNSGSITAGSGGGAAATGSLDYQTFLRMLTTQMTNQDPLKPLESTEYATQLATFSSVEQQTRTNQLLTGLLGQFSVLGMAQLAGWVGQEVRAQVPVWMDGDPVTLSPNPSAGADRAVLVVRNDKGNVVSREDIPVSTAPYRWLGADIAGDPLPQGLYTLELESYNGERLMATSAVESYASIIEAQSGASGIRLLLEGGVSVDATAVTALRRPDL